MGHFEELAQNAREDRNRMFLVVGVVGVVFVALTFSYFFLYEPPFSYGEEKRAILHLENELKAEPCDRSKSVRFSELLNKAGDFRRTLVENERFFSECGDHHRLLWTSQYAHEQLSEWDNAIKTATQLMEDDPSDVDFPWWRGKTHLAKGDFESAIRDFRFCQDLSERVNAAPFDLAKALEKAGRPCEGLFPIRRYLLSHPKQVENERVQSRLEQIYLKGKCNQLVQGGVVELRMLPLKEERDERAQSNRKRNKKPKVQVAVTIGESVPRAMLVGLRVPYTILSKEDAALMGVVATDEKIMVRTNGHRRKEAHLAFAKNITLDNLTLKNIEVAIVDTIDMPILGFSFFSRFDVDQDFENNTMRLSPR
ncbi:MAG: hypothetical protein GY822_08145 [Deltaproteobacteria bacterium]|nr:hypothetical protein [Deltaproteobacteria bacterium]